MYCVHVCVGVYICLYMCICVCVCKYACMRITLVCLSMVECYFKPARLVHSAQSFSQHYRSVFQTHSASSKRNGNSSLSSPVRCSYGHCDQQKICRSCGE